MRSGSKYNIDMTHGPLFSKIVLFTIPLIITNVMQLMFHAADLIVLGQFADPKAMAGVGATNGLTTFMINLFLGLSTGVHVLTARYTGAKDPRNLARTVHTSMAVAFYGGIVMAAVGFLLCRPILKLMATPSVILDKACIYMWIYCAGMPFVIIYNFGGSVMRAMGDTRRPLIFMVIAGLTNVLLNLFFVLVCHWDVAGVAVATKISNAVSAILVLRVLTRSRDASRLFWNRIKIHWPTFKNLAKIGLPAGLQGCCFSIANITIQSTINSFGPMAIAGNTTSQSLEGIVNTCNHAAYTTAISFVGQNHGAQKYKRIVKSIFYVAIFVIFVNALGWLFYVYGRPLLNIYNPNPEVIRWGMIRFRIMMLTYFLCGFMNTVTGAMRGLGYSITPTIVSLTGACFFRIAWIIFIFPLNPKMETLIFSYPSSWTMVTIINGILLYFVIRGMFRRQVASHHGHAAVVG
ncbi:MAG: MATE family efflux transporter [Lentisphaeria bacterium]|nr:MATE family efflux transporter [Lentisphaeria bacterium]